MDELVHHRRRRGADRRHLGSQRRDDRPERLGGVSTAIRWIVVAAHRKNIGRLILGSNAHAIMRDAPCDVLLVRDYKT
ncbi:universal stress protein [Qipengyuania sp. SM2507]